MRELNRMFDKRIPFDDRERFDVPSTTLKESDGGDLSQIADKELIVNDKDELLIRKDNQVKKVSGAGGIGKDGQKGRDGSKGRDGDNAYLYVAYASDDSGTDFTMTFDPDLDYIAILNTNEEIETPEVSDFDGLWQRYKNEPDKIPSAFVETSTPSGTTSATLEDVPDMSVDITLDQEVEVFIAASFEIETQSGASASTIGVAFNIDGIDHLEHQRYLSGASDKGLGAIIHRIDALTPDTYTVKLRYRRVDGVATPGINNASLFVMALQSAKGEKGDTGDNGADGEDGANGVGVPPGGTTGQALVKKSNDDFDTEWATLGIISGLTEISFTFLGLMEVAGLSNLSTVVSLEAS